MREIDDRPVAADAGRPHATLYGRFEHGVVLILTGVIAVVIVATLWSLILTVVQGIVAAVTRLVEDPGLRRRLGATARADVATIYSLEQWNRGLKRVLDHAVKEVSF